LSVSSEPDGAISGPARILQTLRERLADGSDRSVAQRSAGSAFIIRVAGAALIFLTQVILARWMGGHEFGIYVYVWTWVILFGDLTDLGLASAAQRFIPQYTRAAALEMLRGFIAGSRLLTVSTATAAALVGFGAIKLLEPYLDSYLILPFAVGCATLPLYGFMQMQDGIARSYNWIKLALLPLYILRQVVMLALIGLAYVVGLKADATTALIATVVACWGVAIGQALFLNRKLKQVIEPGPKAYEPTTWLGVSLPIFIVEGFYLLLMNVDILVLQRYRSPEEVAVYYAAAKTLTIVAFVYFAVAAAVAHRFTEYHGAGDRERLAALVADAVRWTFWPSLAATALILALGRPLLWLFGDRFVEGYALMFALAIGLVARASVGPAERLLSMVGQQRICAAVLAVAFVINLGLCLLLIPRFGLMGAGIATSVALIAESMLLFLVTKRRLGLHLFVLGRQASR
jgi:O-antigen/teichoic acid export membrane protein